MLPMGVATDRLCHM